MRLLIVEDEPKTGSYLRKGLTESGFTVDLARTGSDGLAMAIEHEYDLIVLDVMLPGLDGWQILAKLRERKQTPVLFLTARDDVADRVKGLELGADDYLVKPFAFSELLARIRTLLRRGAVREIETMHVADLDIDVLKRRVTRAGVRIDLTAKEFGLLEYLLRNKNRVISRAEISEKVWDASFDTSTNVIDVYINFLRKKIDKEFPTKIIHTMVGMGYIIKTDD